MRDARANLANASAAYQAATAAAKATVATTPQYRQAAEQVNVAERQLAAVRADDHAKPAQLDAAVRRLFAARIEVSKFDTAAMANSTDVATTRDAWMDANAKVIDLQRTFEASIQISADFRAAKSRLEGARKQLARD